MAKRLTKKDVFAAQGVEFKDGQIRTPFGNWVSPLLVKGNSKVGEAAKTFSIMHGCETYTRDSFKFDDIKAVFDIAGCDAVQGSCNGHCEGCYCDSGNFTRYSTAYKGMLFKLLLCRMFPDFVKRALTAQITAEKIDQVRIHAAGDFFGDEYISVWHDVIAACPNCIFWTYTKNPKAENAFDDLENVSVVPSVTPYGFNFGTCAELLEKYEALTRDGFRVHICACGTDYEKHCCDCKTGCKATGSICDYVLFIKHSVADYKAGKTDPEEFARVCDIIRKQDN